MWEVDEWRARLASTDVISANRFEQQWQRRSGDSGSGGRGEHPRMMIVDNYRIAITNNAFTFAESG